jgi:predicted peroxiredoxin
MGKVSKGTKCSVSNCKESATRSLSADKVLKYIRNAKPSGSKVYLCKSHYKLWKKASKEDREIERLRYST